jgi:hypothetical protein
VVVVMVEETRIVMLTINLLLKQVEPMVVVAEEVLNIKEIQLVQVEQVLQVLLLLNINKEL